MKRNKEKNKKVEKYLFGFSLLLVFLLALLIRIIGIYPGHPPNHPDEPITYLTAIQMVLNRELDPFTFSSYKFQYPGLLIYIQTFFFTFIFIPVSLLLKLITDTSFVIDHLGTFGDLVLNVVGPGYMNAIFWGRYVVALLGFCAVIVTFLIGKQLFNKYVGLIAALFLAVNFRHNASSHLSLVDAPNSLFALLSFYLSIRLLEKPSRKNYILAGIGIALSLATKLYLFSLLPFLLIHLYLSLKKKKPFLILKSLFSINFILSILCVGFIFVLLNPFLIFHFGQALETHTINNLRYGFGANSLNIYPVWYLFEIGMGKPFSIFFLIGVVLAVLYKKYMFKALLLLLLIVIPTYMLIYYSNGGGYVRNFTSIIPFVLIFSALGVYHTMTFLVEKINPHLQTLKYVAVIVFAVFVSFSQLHTSIQMDYYLSKEWSSKCILENMNSVLKDGQRVSRTPIVPEASTKKIEYSNHTNFYVNKAPYSLSELRDAEIDYLILNTDIIMSTFIWWTGTGTRFWGMPLYIFDNSYEGLAIKELSRHRVVECIYPFPYIAENYFMMKIPKRQIHKNEKLLKSIDSSFQIEPKNPPLIPERLSLSNPIPVTPGKKYIVKAVVKSAQPLLDKVRDGFIRIDFYSSNPDKKRGIISAISSRYFGEAEWKELEVSEVAPQGSKFMTISFQLENYTTTLQVEKVVIFEADANSDEVKTANTKEVEDTVIYPNHIL